MSHPRILASLVLGVLCAAGLQRAGADEPPEPKPTLERRFQALMKDFGKGNADEVVVLSGPKPVLMNRGKTPGREWRARIGETPFKLSIEDAVKLEAKDLSDTLRRLPPAYRNVYRIVSDERENGVAVYADLGGDAAHGSKDYLNVVPGANGLVIAHESGHVLEQYASQDDPTTLERWKGAIAADGISVSPYGDTVVHEDLAEFARIYAQCLDAGAEHLTALKELSPRRTELWEKILAVPYTGEKSTPKAPTLEGRFEALTKDFGAGSTERLLVLSGPRAVEMGRGNVPGREWRVQLGGVTFRLRIESKIAMEVKDQSATLRRVPRAYRKAFPIVSEDKRGGVAVYADLGGDLAQGAKDHLDVTPAADALSIAREAGRVLAQKATDADPAALDAWKGAIAADKVSVSPKGDSAATEDLVEFARIHALCLGSGPEHLAELKRLSARRTELWERMLAAKTR